MKYVESQEHWLIVWSNVVAHEPATGIEEEQQG